MTSSNQYLFEMDNASILIEAFDRCSIRPTALTRDQLLSGRRSLNLELISWSNKGVNLFNVYPFTVQIVQGQASYVQGSGVTNISANCVSMLDVYFSVIDGGGSGVNIDRIMLPMSRTEYAEFPNKLAQGNPSMYWFQKTPTRTLTIYQPPAVGYPTNQISGYYLSTIQDANLGTGETPDVDKLSLDALCAKVAVRISVKYAPEKYDMLKKEAKEAWDEFAETNREDAPISIWPSGGYFRER